MNKVRRTLHDYTAYTALMTKFQGISSEGNMNISYNDKMGMTQIYLCLKIAYEKKE